MTAEAKKSKAGKAVRLQYYRSTIATPEKHKRVVRGLGFTRLHQVVEREDTPSIRGMVAVVPHLVRILEN
ncbi:MAG TPA: 50S ribosomal protein L30 [Acidobacteriaceae bacterium]|jgi:large subunit ribosomal protein L30|nr:50S ribosomal protein L30 [Acidobacteriaceae bacterium]